MHSFKIEEWIDAEEVARVDTSEYWNDKQLEREKKTFIDIDYQKLERNKKLNQIVTDLKFLIKVSDINLLSSSILSLGSGTCWLEGRCFEPYKDSISLTAVDFSRHRIHEIAPKTLQHYGFSAANVTLAWGSMLDLKIGDETHDIVLLSQAFHHSSEPIALLREIRRVLTPTGIVFIVGEHFYSSRVRIKRTLKHLIKYLMNFNGNYRSVHSLIPDYQSLFPRCYLKGDMHYPMVEYDAMFTGAGFSYQRFVNEHRELQSFILRKL